MKLSSPLVCVRAAVAIIVLALVATQALPSSTVIGSYAAEACSEEVSQQREDTGGISFGRNFQCNAQLPPSTWSNTHVEIGEAQYDVALVGAGIGTAYVLIELKRRLGNEAFLKLKIGIFEKGDHAGGRLMSAFGGGALGLAVSPAESQYHYPEPEYGGMRIDARAHPRIWNLVQQENHKLWPDSPCEIIEPSGKVNCPAMLVPMEVGAVRYASSNSKTGPVLESSTITGHPSELWPNGFNLEAVASGAGSPFDQCVLFGAVALPAFYDGDLAANAPKVIKDAVKEACGLCSNGKVLGLCRLCEAFPDPVEAMRSCTGYEYIKPDMATTSAVGFMFEVINVDGSEYYSLFVGGFQRFLQGIMFSDTSGRTDTAIQFGKQLTGISLENSRGCSQQAVDELLGQGKPNRQRAESEHVQLDFADGSRATARSVYLTPLPADLIKFDGLEAWKPVVEAHSNPEAYAMVKVVLSWNGFSLSSALDLTPCWPGPCHRLILDGPAGKYITRQVWLWDDSTIMVYLIAQGDEDAPVNLANEVVRTKGMGALAKKITEELSEAVGFAVPIPRFVRLKSWPLGNVAFFAGLEIFDADPELAAQKLSTAISRPFGDQIPVFYGNSEMAGDTRLHGWAEGALEMADLNMDSLVESLSTKKGLRGGF